MRNTQRHLSRLTHRLPSQTRDLARLGRRTDGKSRPMNRRTAQILILPMLAVVCSCASSSSTPNQDPNNNTGSNNVGGSVINGKVSPDAQGNNRDQPIQTDTVTTP